MLSNWITQKLPNRIKTRYCNSIANLLLTSLLERLPSLFALHVIAGITRSATALEFVSLCMICQLVLWYLLLFLHLTLQVTEATSSLVLVTDDHKSVALPPSRATFGEVLSTESVTTTSQFQSEM